MKPSTINIFRQAFTNPGRVILVRLLTLGLNFGFSLLIARCLNPEDSGLVFLVISVTVFSSIVAKLGTDYYLLRVGANPESTLEALVFGVALIFVSFIVLAVPLFFLIDASGIFGRNGMDPFVIWGILLASLPQAVFSSLSSFIRGRGKNALGLAIEQGMYQGVAGMCVLFLLIIGNLNLTSVLVAVVAGSWVTAIFASVVAVVYRPRERSTGEANFKHLLKLNGRELIGSGSASSLFYLASVAPSIILGFSGSFEDISYFTVAQKISGLLLLVPAIQISLIAPRIAKSTTDNYLQVNKYLRKANYFSVMTASIFFIPILLMPSLIVQLLFGSSYLPATELVLILGLSYYVSIWAGNVFQIAQIIGQSALALAFAGLSLGIWITAGPTIAKDFGATGISIALGLMVTTFAFIAAAIMKRKTGIQITFALGGNKWGKNRWKTS